ncbi:MAG TPA: hypothetical protein VMP03_01145 [Methylomirabilota bacterium]|nr:hypothetical protein [Methylomirabilota bacterium]
MLALVRLMLASGCIEPETSTLLTNETAVDGLARKLTGETGGKVAGTRTAVMALRDLVWRVDTARVLIEPRLDAAGCAELAELLSTEDIHALLREIS